MKVEKIILFSYVYTLFSDRVFAFWLRSSSVHLANYTAKNSYQRMSLAIMLNSRRHDVTLLERYVGQSTGPHLRLLGQLASSVYEASWSKKVCLRYVCGKCKYSYLY